MTLSPNQKKLTKIVVSISDRNCSPTFIKNAIEAGGNIFRLNTAHMEVEAAETVIRNIRSISKNIGILIDTKGPEIRTTGLAKGVEDIILKKGQEIYVKGTEDHHAVSTKECVFVNFPDIYLHAPKGTEIIFSDGDVKMDVVEVEGNKLLCTVKEDAKLGARKTVNIPSIAIPLPSVTPKDKTFIELAKNSNEIDFIAHSFVRSRQDVLDVINLLPKDSHIKIIAKIENQQGIDNIDEILDTAYGVMIARGDLGVEIPFESIPKYQKIIIEKSVAKKKPVIVATQMLESMIKNPRPTRAEVTDVFYAVKCKTDAVMLSGETAKGVYPIESIQTMTRILEFAEESSDVDALQNLSDHKLTAQHNDLESRLTALLARQAVESTEENLNIKAIIADSVTGRTARNLASFRGHAPIYAICYRKETARRLDLSFGVRAFYIDPKDKTEKQNLAIALQEVLIANGHLKNTDLVVHMSGNIGANGSTNSLEVDTVENLIKKYCN